MTSRDWIIPPPTVYPDRRAIDRIIAVTAKYAGLSVADLCGPTRVQHVFIPRAVAMRVCRDYTDASLTAIGAAFGGRDHTTIMSALRSFDRWADDDLRQSVDAIAALAGCFHKRKEAQ